MTVPRSLTIPQAIGIVSSVKRMISFGVGPPPSTYPNSLTQIFFDRGQHFFGGISQDHEDIMLTSII